jgi:hypothetical protein
MSSKRQTLVSAIAVLGLAAVFGWWLFFSGFVLRTHKQNFGNRQAMLRMREAIPIGTSFADVRSAFERFRTPELRMMEDSATRWSFEMPLEGAEQAWKLFVEFEGGKVKAIRVRTGDGVPPRDAPGDLEVPTKHLQPAPR